MAVGGRRRRKNVWDVGGRILTNIRGMLEAVIHKWQWETGGWMQQNTKREEGCYTPVYPLYSAVLFKVSDAALNTTGRFRTKF